MFYVDMKVTEFLNCFCVRNLFEEITRGEKFMTESDMLRWHRPNPLDDLPVGLADLLIGEHFVKEVVFVHYIYSEQHSLFRCREKKAQPEKMRSILAFALPCEHSLARDGPLPQADCEKITVASIQPREAGSNPRRLSELLRANEPFRDGGGSNPLENCKMDTLVKSPPESFS